MTSGPQVKVFLSYSRDDRDAAREIYGILREAAIDVWYDEVMLRVGAQIMPVLEQAMSSADAMLLLIGNHVALTGYHQLEIQSAIERANRDRAFRVVPLLLPGATLEQIPAPLLSYQYLDLRDASQRRRQLLQLAAVLAKDPSAGTPADDEEVGDRLRDAGDAAGSIPYYARAVAALDGRLAEHQPRVAALHRKLGTARFDLGQLEGAQIEFEWALSIDTVLHGDYHQTVASDISNLAALLRARNRLSEAEPLMHRALAIDEAILGTDHPSVAIRLNNLAQLLQDTNRLDEAEPLMRRALAIDEACFGTNHPNVAIRLSNLAALLHDTLRLDEAEPLYRRALAIDEASLGTDHPSVATRLNNLSLLLQDTNRLGEAEPLMRRALAIDEASLGTDHPSVAIRLNNLAGLLQATNRLGEAEPLMRRALAIDEASLGTDHPNVATRLNNLAELLRATNRLGEAEPLARRALAIFLAQDRSIGREHPSRVTVEGNYERLLSAMGKTPAETAAIIATLRREAGFNPV